MTDRARAPKRLSLVLPLSPSAETAAPGPTPYYLVSGLGGHVMPFQAMARSIDHLRPGFGILFPAIADADEQFDRVEDLATRMLSDLRAHRAQGPYLLVGYSFGGLVVHEMARRLADEGQTVGTVTIDAISPNLMKQRPLPIRAGYKLYRRLRQMRLGGPKPRKQSPSRLARTIAELRQNSLLARFRYHPPATSVPSVVIRREDLPDARRFYRLQDDLGWSNVAQVAGVLHTTGTHLDLFKGDNATVLAAKIVEALDLLEALEPQEASQAKRVRA
ncbi:alpha/beta fold hydrolase [Rhodobacterales bacterium HKCCE3408]|nr:alpha/beta fold hydrolase [Rhodobacterales bacterium HKCCE3408]